MDQLPSMVEESNRITETLKEEPAELSTLQLVCVEVSVHVLSHF